MRIKRSDAGACLSHGVNDEHLHEAIRPDSALARRPTEDAEQPHLIIRGQLSEQHLLVVIRLLHNAKDNIFSHQMNTKQPSDGRWCMRVSG